MDLSLFEDHLDRLGGDLSRWPTASRAEAEALLATSPRARVSLATMADVEGFLQVHITSQVASNAGEVDGIAASAMRHRQVVPARRFAMRAGWGVAAATALFLGYFVGDLTPQAPSESPYRVMALALDTQQGSVDVD